MVLLSMAPLCGYLICPSECRAGDKRSADEIWKGLNVELGGAWPSHSSQPGGGSQQVRQLSLKLMHTCTSSARVGMVSDCTVCSFTVELQDSGNLPWCMLF